MLDLRCRCGLMRRAPGCLFRLTRACDDAAFPAVEAYPADCGVIHGGLRVGVSDISDIHVAHSGVIEEVLTLPMSAVVPVAGIAVPVVDAAVEADGCAPVTGIPRVSTVVKAPISGCPEQTNFGRLFPGPWHPKVTVLIVVPITGRPDRALFNEHWLLINEQSGRCKGDGHLDLRPRKIRQRHHRNSQRERAGAADENDIG